MANCLLLEDSCLKIVEPVLLGKVAEQSPLYESGICCVSSDANSSKADGLHQVCNAEWASSQMLHFDEAHEGPNMLGGLTTAAKHKHAVVKLYRMPYTGTMHDRRPQLHDCGMQPLIPFVRRLRCQLDVDGDLSSQPLMLLLLLLLLWLLLLLLLCVCVLLLSLLLLLLL